MRMLALPINALLVAALASSSAFAGVYLESTDTDLGTKKPPRVSKMWSDGGRMRSENDAGEASAHIAIFKNRTMYTLGPKSKTCRVIDQATVDKMGGMISDARRQMEAQLANMPPDRRAMMEKMKRRSPSARIPVTNEEGLR